MINVHFIAIGGSVMHQLAIALSRKGDVVTGSDDEIFEPAKSNLERQGLLPEKMGWDAEKITTNLDAIILGMHAKDDNPELIKANEIGLKIYSFPEYIFEESRNKTRIVVGGSHGKTTVTSMIMHVFKESRQPFDYLVGARLKGFPQSVNITDAPVIICEGDEYPASTLEKRPKFHFLYPHIAIITGIAWDHVNVFPTFDFYLKQFIIFINKMESGGTLIYNETDNILMKLVKENKREDIHYKPYSIPQHEVKNGITSITIDGETTSLQVFGNHNLLNLQAAYLACTSYGISASLFMNAIGTFTGAAKRLEIIASDKTTTIFRDFAHAPSKVKATINAVKNQFLDRKLYAVLELHTYSSLSKSFLNQYAGAMDEADVAIVFYSHHALHVKRLPDLNEQDIMNGFAKKDMIVINDKEELWQWLVKQDYQNTSLLLMSSGDYDGLPLHELIEKVRSDN